MCSNIESDFDGALSEKKVVNLEDDVKCKKCNLAKAVLILRVKDAYCQECFLASSIHKFRATLGKHKVMKPGDKVLIGFHGNASSISLLHLIQCGSEHANQKRMLFHSLVVVIDEFGIFQPNKSERLDLIKGHLSILKKFGFPTFICPLESCISDSLSIHEVSENFNYEFPEESETRSLCKLFEDIAEPSAKEFLLGQMKRKLLVRIAEAMEISKVFTAESATSLAVTLLSGLAMGRGAQLSLDTAFSDSRVKEVNFIRPMREFSRKEISLYLSFNSLPEPCHFPSFSLKRDALFSIEKLTEDFVVGLQEEFPSTIPTVFRTGDKLNLTQEKIKDLENNFCLLCHGLLDVQENGKPNTYQATKFSQMVSQKGPKNIDPENLISENIQNLKLENDGDSIDDKNEDACNGKKENCSDGGICCSSVEGKTSTTTMEKKLQKHLCYSCRLTVDKLPSAPDFLGQELDKKIRRMKMRESINDFIL